MDEVLDHGVKVGRMEVTSETTQRALHASMVILVDSDHQLLK